MQVEGGGRELAAAGRQGGEEVGEGGGEGDGAANSPPAPST
jgi:hypothetical protein